MKHNNIITAPASSECLLGALLFAFAARLLQTKVESKVEKKKDTESKSESTFL